MLQVIQEKEHFRKDHGWLDTYHHFSFAEYFNPEKVNYGPLRVFNDDIVQPGSGFGFHPHKDMEIVTYVIDGELEHKDNFGNHGIISAGGVQRMSAGTGVIHSEYNHSKEKPLRLLQLWFLTKKKDLKPSWEERQFAKQDRLNRLLPVVSGDDSDDKVPLKIHQDSKIYISSLTQDTKLDYELKSGRQTYTFVISGRVDLNGRELKDRDAAMIDNANKLSFKAAEPTELILIDLPVEFSFNQ